MGGIFMSGLQDLEALSLKVKNPNVRILLKEAIACYNASAYRACIILSFNALIDDLLIKIDIMKSVNKNAKSVFEVIQQLIKEQKSFENTFIELLKKYELFDELDEELCKTLQGFRHKSAHPSGYNPTAEAARFVLVEVVNRFLSKESLLTSSRIDKLLSDVVESNFFINSDVKHRSQIMKSEIADIHEDAYPQLINRLYKSYIKDKELPYLSAIFALARINNPTICNMIMKYVIKNNISKKGHEVLFTGIITTMPQYFNDIDDITAEKLIKNLNTQIKNMNKNLKNNAIINPFNSILHIFNKTSNILYQKAIDLLPKLIEHNERLCYFMKNIDKSPNSMARDAYIKLYSLLINEIKSNKIEKSEAICKVILEDDMQSFKKINDQRAFELINAILLNKSNSQYISNIISNKFNQITYLKDKAKKHFDAMNDKDKLDKKYNKIITIFNK